MKEKIIVKGIVRKDGKYLLLRESEQHKSSKCPSWECPGGRVNQGENIKQALKREIKEETGLAISLIKELPVFKLQKEEVTEIIYVFLAEAKTKNIELSDEHTDYQWIAPENLNKLDHCIYKDTLQNYFKMAGEYSK